MYTVEHWHYVDHVDYVDYVIMQTMRGIANMHCVELKCIERSLRVVRYYVHVYQCSMS